MNNAAASSLVSEFLARPGNARIALAAGAALFDVGESELAVALWTLGDDANPIVRRIRNNPEAPELGRRLSTRADAELCTFLTGLHRKAVDDFEAHAGAKVERVRGAVWPLTHTSPVTYRVPGQRPIIFYMPDLRAAPIEPNDAFAWVAALEANTAQIRRECEAAIGAGVDAQPYVPAGTNVPEWSKLSGSLDWSAIHVYKDARETRALAQFPETARALATVDLARIDGTPMEVFFSRLRPGAHIPPHHGLTNTRVTVHLPLVVPGDCAIRVADQIHVWREGRILAFDDSFEHEAWNRSGLERVVLIFEAWHPDLSAHERAAIEHVFHVRQTWLDTRRAKLEAWQLA